MIKIEINNKAKCPVETKAIKKKVSKVVKILAERGALDLEAGVELSLAFVAKEEIARLNGQYRKKQEPTDVLSFAYEEQGLNGELVLCYDIIKENAQQEAVAPELELNKNIIHGILHILGYEHGKAMFQLQDQLVCKI